MPNPKDASGGRRLKHVEQEVMLRLRMEDKREHDNAMATARWDSQLAAKAEAAEKRRQRENLRNETKATAKLVREVRRERLATLYAEDEQLYSEELNMQNLAFRTQQV